MHDTREKLKSLLMQKGFGVEGATIAADHLIANGVRLEEKQATSEESKRQAMYVIQAGDDGKFYCGMRYWDKQLRKAKIYHSLAFAKDVAKAYEECKCKILEVDMEIVGEVNNG